MSLATTLMGLGIPAEPATRIGYSEQVPVDGTGTVQAGAAWILKFNTNIACGTDVGDTAFILPADAELMQPYFVLNTTPEAALVYPPVGDTIDEGAVNAPVSIAQDFARVFQRVEDGRWVSFQSGFDTLVVQSIVAGTGIAVDNTDPEHPVISNTGVLSVTPGTGIANSGTAQNPVIENTGVLSVTAGTNVSITGTAQNPIINSSNPGGTVQTVSVVSANGFAGSSDGNPANPALTLSTTVNGLLEGNGTAASAAPQTGTGDVVRATGGVVTNTVATATTGTIARSLANLFADRLNVKDFGATGDGVTDDTAAINLALASASVLKLYFPKGTYICTSPLVFDGDKLVIEGDGQYSSILKWTADVDGIQAGQVSAVEHIYIHDVGLITTQAASSRAAVRFTADRTGNQKNPSCIFERMDIRGDVTTADWWGHGIKATDPALPIFRDLQIFGRSGGTSAQIAGLIGIEMVGSVLSVCPIFDNVFGLDLDKGLYIHTTGNPGIEGIYVTKCNFTHVNYGVHVLSDAVGGYKSAQVHIINNQFQAYTQGVRLAECLHINVSDNLIYSDGSATTDGIFTTACVYGNIGSNQIEELAGTIQGIDINNSANIIVADNHVRTSGTGVDFTGFTFESYESGTVQDGSGAAFANTSGAATNRSVVGELQRLATNGIITRTSGVALAARTISAGIGIDVTNGDGVSGNPTLAVKAGTVRENIMGINPNNILAAGATQFFTWQANATENVISAVVAVPGTMRDMRAVNTVAPGGAATTTYTLMKNGVAQTLTCQVVGAGTTASDLVNTVSFNAGDTWSIRAVASAGAANTLNKASVSFLPTVT